MKHKSMKLVSRSTCKLCGRTGRELYGGLRDRLFSAPGTWSLRECPEPACGLLWLDPEPSEDDIGLLYQSYYTHGTPTARANWLRRAFGRLSGLLLKTTTVARDRQKLQHLFVDDLTPGDLLEVGCGAGSRLARFAQMGWRVTGQEIDPVAASEAVRQSAAEVHVGPIKELLERGRKFDVIVTNHVIEHVVRPVEFLRICLAMLRPGGQVICVTPNARSWGHHAFGAHWMSLDPPRHISLFTAAALSAAARSAGFDSLQVFTSCANAQAFAMGSLEIASKGRFDMQGVPSWRAEAFSLLAQVRALSAFHKNRDSGDELILRCQAP